MTAVDRAVVVAVAALFLLSSLGEQTASAQRPPPGAAKAAKRQKWYRLGGVGHHLLNKRVATNTISGKQARAFFDAKGLKAGWITQSKTNLKKEARLAHAALRADYRRRGASRFLPRRFPVDSLSPFAEIEAFSKSEAVVAVKVKFAARRWHHFYWLLAKYRIARDRWLDRIFSLGALEKKFSFTYQGVGHGTPMSSPAVKALGQIDSEYPGQSPSLREVFYRKHRLYLNIHHGVVYFARKQDAPGW